MAAAEAQKIADDLKNIYLAPEAKAVMENVKPVAASEYLDWPWFSVAWIGAFNYDLGFDAVFFGGNIT